MEGHAEEATTKQRHGEEGRWAAVVSTQGALATHAPIILGRDGSEGHRLRDCRLLGWMAQAAEKAESKKRLERSVHLQLSVKAEKGKTTVGASFIMPSQMPCMQLLHDGLSAEELSNNVKLAAADVQLQVPSKRASARSMRRGRG